LLEQLEKERRRKLELIRSAGHDPYGSRFPHTRSLGELAAAVDAEAGSQVTAVGRIGAIRSFGKAAFFDLRDSSGRLQAHIRKDGVSEAVFTLFQYLDAGDIVGVSGQLGRTKTGEPTIFVGNLTILSKALLPPPEKWHGLRDVEIRYRKRYVDLFSSPESMARFRARSIIVETIRRFLTERGFLEVETPMMQDIPGGAAARPFATHHNALDMDLYLRVSPELFLKKLLVGGMERVFEINRNFRNEGISTRHHPEFTMLEAYQAYGNYEDMMELTESLIMHLIGVVRRLPGVQMCETLRQAASPWPRRRYADLLREYADVDLRDAEAIRARARALGLQMQSEHKDVVAEQIFEAAVEPRLRGPIFVTHYPLAVCPLAKAVREEPDLAERFELYVDSMEIANAYTELNDPLEQERRFLAQVDTGKGEHRAVDWSFIDALKYGMPPAGGLGIGIDRLVMLLTNTNAIRDVILFPILRRVAEPGQE